MYLEINVPPKCEQEALDLLKDTISELKTKPVSEQELKIAKIQMIDHFNSNCERNDDIATILKHFSTNGSIDAYKNHIKYINDLTPEDINKIAEQYLYPKKAAIVISKKSKAKSKEISFSGKNIIQPKFIKEYLLPNNIKLIINDTDSKIRTALKFTINTNTNSKPGVPNIFATIINSVNEEMAILQNEKGVSFEINATSKGLSVETFSIKESLPSAIKILKSIIFEPIIDKQSFKEAVKNFLRELNYIDLTAEKIANEVMYQNNPEEISLNGLRMGIKKAKIRDIQDYYAALLEEGFATVTLTGPISKMNGLRENVISDLSEIDLNFSKGKINKPKFILPTKNQIAVKIENYRDQSEIFQLFHFSSPTIKDTASMLVLDGILSGGFNNRLFNDLREKQKLGYDINSIFLNKINYGQEYLTIKTGIKDKDGNLNDNLKNAILGFEKHIKNFIQTLPSEEEVQFAKKELYNNNIMDMATADGENSTIAKGVELKNDPFYINKLLSAISKVTSKDVQEVAKKYLTQPSATAIITTEEAAIKFEDFLKTKGEYTLYKNY